MRRSPYILALSLRDKVTERVLVRMIPQQRRGVPEDLAGLVVYLASEASSFLTGQTVFVEGACCLTCRRCGFLYVNAYVTR